MRHLILSGISGEKLKDENENENNTKDDDDDNNDDDDNDKKGCSTKVAHTEVKEKEIFLRPCPLVSTAAVHVGRYFLIFGGFNNKKRERAEIWVSK